MKIRYKYEVVYQDLLIESETVLAISNNKEKALQWVRKYYPMYIEDPNRNPYVVFRNYNMHTQIAIREPVESFLEFIE